MRLRRPVLFALTCGAALALASATEARAVSPQNPYRSFNLSGLNYGSMQWEKAQRQGKRVWPSSNTPAGQSTRSSRGLFRRR